jgi:hypothetical protein
MGDLGTDFAISAIMGDPSMMINLQQARAEKQRYLAATGLENPSLIQSSPEVAAAVESLFGEGSAQSIFAQSQPQQVYMRQAIGMGLDIEPPGTIRADGTTVPGLIEQFNQHAWKNNTGFRIGPDGLQLNRAAPSHEEITSSLSFSAWATLAEGYEKSGMEQSQAFVAAAQQVMVPLSKAGVIVDPAIRKLAFAKTQADIDAYATEVKARATKGVDVAFEQSLGQLGARGKEIGKVEGQAAAAGMTVEIQKPDGTVIKIPMTQAGKFFEGTSRLAEAITDQGGAVALGRNPSKAQQTTVAMMGMDIVMDASGELHGLPIGHLYGGPTLTGGELIVGPEARARLDEVIDILDQVDTIDNLYLAFPSEKEHGRAKARALAKGKSFVRGLVDSPELLTARSRTRQFGFQMARIIGSNSQLSDAERRDASALLEPLREGTGTAEMVREALGVTRATVMRKLERIRYPGVKPAAGGLPAQQPAAVSAGQPAQQPAAPAGKPKPIVLKIGGRTINAEEVQ